MMKYARLLDLEQEKKILPSSDFKKEDSLSNPNLNSKNMTSAEI